MPAVNAVALDGIPEIHPGEDLAEAITAALPAGGPEGGTVLVIAHKVVSKAEGRIRRLSEVAPSRRARELATELGKDPRQVQVILDESAEIRRAERGILIAETHHGFVCANAGVDASNAPGEDAVILLPTDPDASARSIRAGLRARLGTTPAVVITDSFGRAWRQGQTDVAIGCAGLRPLDDWRGRLDAYGRALHATVLAVADALAAAADLARAKDAMQPVVLLTGLDRHVTEEDGPGAAALIRERDADLFR